MYDTNEKDAQLSVAKQELSVFPNPTSKGGYMHSMHEQNASINGISLNANLQISEFTVRELRKVLVKIVELVRTALWIGPTYHLMTMP